MKTTTTMILGLVGLAMLAGCSGSDDPESSGASSAPSTSGLQCGSAGLFSQSHDACGAMIANGSPGDDGIECRCLIGYKWTGSQCSEVTGCQCLGEDCDKLAESQEACELNHASCGATPSTTPSFACGSSDLLAHVHDACTAMDASAAPDQNGDCYCMLGYAWDGASCEALANCQCLGADCDKLTDTKEACEQAHATCEVEVPTTLHCGSSELFSLTHDRCEAMDAASAPDEAGSCNCFLGFAWNGTACEALADCACEGQDCDKLTQTVEDCELAHAACVY